MVNVHGSSGLSTDDEACRVAQVEQVFVDLGDGSPGTDGERNLVLGDLNTDPGRWADIDTSAAPWTDFVGDDHDFHFISAIGEDAPRSYQGLLDIDHVMSDALDGGCVIEGVSDGTSPVFDGVYFDHHPVVCTVSEPGPPN